MSEIRDYNGKGRWSHESVERRFESYSKTFGESKHKLELKTHEEGMVKWIYPLMDSVIKGIKKQDLSCIELGIELIEDGDSMPFGMILKSNTARALRQSADKLSEDQRHRIRKRVADMLIGKYMPREFIQYVKLIKTVGFGDEIDRVRSEGDLENNWVNHYLKRIQIK